MIPKIHSRAHSFQTSTNYVLHDPKAKSSDRVLWASTANLGDVDPEQAWQKMDATWRDRTRLKRESGADLRGRDNKTPVLHYTLAWSPDQRPDQAHMLDTALWSLKALKLDQHQAVIAAHSDKDHWHVHIVVNTVHPETGRTAPLKYSQLELSRWAEEYERRHGIEIQQRIDNNAERQRRRDENERTPPDATQAFTPPPPKAPRVSRVNYITHAEIVDRMKRHRAEYESRHLVERDVAGTQHRAEWQDLARDTKSAAEVAIANIATRFKSRWRDLYEAQRIEVQHVTRIQSSPLERATYVITNSERLGNGAALSTKTKLALINSPTKLFKAVDTLHKRERGMLSAVQTAERMERMERIWRSYQGRADSLHARHRSERQTRRTEQLHIAKNGVDYIRARNEMILERRGQRPVRTAADAPPLENDVQYVARKKAEARAFYERNAGPEARARMAFKPVPLPVQAPPEPKPPTPLPALEFNQAVNPTPLQSHEKFKLAVEAYKKRKRDEDFDHEM